MSQSINDIKMIYMRNTNNRDELMKGQSNNTKSKQQQIKIQKRMIGKRLITLGSRAINTKPSYSINHIKNMHEQNIRVQAERIANLPLIESTDRVYKPTYSIEFNREGQVLLYSANPIRNAQIYFKYPYIFYESLIPLSIFNYVLNPFQLAWYWCNFALYAAPALTIPRIWYVADFKYHPRKLFLLRGGKVLKVQAQSLGNQRYTYWFETTLCRPLTEDKLRFDHRDNADFLTEEGQLRYDLNIQVEEFKFFGVNTNNQQLYFKQHGTVHHPELLEAALKGYNIDTTDFTINTADNLRFREPNHDQ